MSTTYQYGSTSNRGLRDALVRRQGLSMHQYLDMAHMSKYVNANPTVSISCQYTQIFTSTNKYNNKLLLGMTEALGRTKSVQSERVTWTLSGAADNFIRIVKVVCTDTRVGEHGQPFDIIVDKPYLNVSQVIMAENNRFKCLVVPPVNGSRAIRAEGGIGYRYTLRLMNKDTYLDPRFIQPGRKWVPISTAVANESNFDGAGFQFNTVFDSFATIGQYARKYHMSDGACRKIKQFFNGEISRESIPSMKDSTGRPIDFDEATSALWVETDAVQNNLGKLEKTYNWIGAFDAKLMNELHNDVELAMNYGLGSNREITTHEGYAITTSKGIREYLETGHLLTHYGEVNLRQLVEWLRSIIQHRVETGKAIIYIDSGVAFADAFDQAIKREASAFLTVDTNFIQGDNPMYLEFGAFFRVYHTFDMQIHVRINDNLSNMLYCAQVLPFNVNQPVDSMRADILDFGMMSTTGEVGKGTDNLLFVSEEFLNYEITSKGKWDPKSFLPIVDGSTGIVGGQVSGYSVIMEKSGGLVCFDTSRMGSIVYAGPTA